MKKLIGIIILLLAGIGSVRADELKGDWLIEGKYAYNWKYEFWYDYGYKQWSPKNTMQMCGYNHCKKYDAMIWYLDTPPVAPPQFGKIN